MVSSEINRLVEIDPASGGLIHSVPIRKPARRASPSQRWWPTVIALCPYNGDFYVCQYAVRHTTCGCGYTLFVCRPLQRDEIRPVARMQGRSVRRFDGRTLAYKRIAAVLPDGAASPEGLCFAKRCMYVAR